MWHAVAQRAYRLAKRRLGFRPNDEMTLSGTQAEPCRARIGGQPGGDVRVRAHAHGSESTHIEKCTDMGPVMQV